MTVLSPGTWPVRRTEILDWLVNDTAQEPYIDNILVELCGRLRASGVMIARANLIVRTNHPQWLGARVMWQTGWSKAEILRLDYEGLDRDVYRNSPVRVVIEGAPEVRGRFHATPADDDPFPFFGEMREAGMTDYVAWPLQFTHRQRHVVSFATDAPGGFSEAGMQVLRDLLPAFTLQTEIRLRNRLARTFLETYVGPHASEQILAGATRRGSGVTVSAVIVVYDLRGFTAISERWPRDDVIAMLNAYFDAICDPVAQHGGEILKFMGDGLLAIFELDRPDACGEALRAVVEGHANMTALNARRSDGDLEPLNYGVGIHLGDVMYGNIGSRARLDFTVIGPAVNVASRLETLTKTVGRGILLSGDFVRQAGPDPRFEPLGMLELPGVGHPTEVFALAEG